MPLRRSSREAWGMSSERELGVKTFALAAVAFLLLGAVLGWALKGGGGGGSDKKNDAQAETLVIDPAVSGLVSAPHTEAGAVKAGTALITGFPNLSVQSAAARSAQLGQVAAPDANADLVSLLEATSQELRRTFLGQPGAEHDPRARVVVTPITSKIDMQGLDSARVQIWYNTVLIDPDKSYVESTWTTANVQLRWTDHWRVVTFDSQLGPTPQPYAPNAVVSDYADVLKVFDGFKAYSSAVR